MATVAHVKTALPRNLTGVNLTDATFQALAAGAGNGADYAYKESDVIVLKNTTAGNAIYTFKITKPTSWPAGASVTHPTITVATLKTVVLRIVEIYKDAANGDKVTIECDVAGSLLVFDLT